eukprot:CAMPEP_0172767334 /NCGR_PEP_ID=MMETSP1074-20121228/182767_1 /TAXON_ID=2916 /ORGANISM="Ceratium fusus, Strain PA161109" /LENGTH=95 /DNA_ID=CAMNT_0013602577 /DNA_START=132 /DNA_END=415 /DNA_ORIENTATION=+
MGPVVHAGAWQGLCQSNVPHTATPHELIVPCASLKAAVSACKKCTRWEQSLKLLVIMKHAALRAEHVTCSVIISSCEKGAEWQMAVAVFSMMGWA